jgi:hypothetical protein
MVAEVSKNATLQLQWQWEIKAICIIKYGDSSMWMRKHELYQR